MASRFVRVLLVILALAATLGLGYRAVQDEIAYARASERVRDVERAADAGLSRAADLRAALYAYVAAGQGHEFWIGHAGALLEGLGIGVRELSEAATRAGLDLDATAEQHVRAITAAEARARKYVAAGQPRLASDVIFTEARNALDNLRLQIAATRESAGATARASHMMLERQRAIFAGGALLVWLLVAALLVPVGREVPGSRVERETAPTGRRQPRPSAAVRAPATPEIAAPARPVAVPAASAAAVPDIAAAAAVCGDLARAASVGEVDGLLERAARVLDASGLIIWLADSASLYPAASWGYDARLLSRVPSIPLDGANLTAAAFRGGSARTSPAEDRSPAALAVPLVGPAGPAGVLSGEIRGVTSVSELTTGVATIFAAQLVTLVGSMPATDTTSSAQQASV